MGFLTLDVLYLDLVMPLQKYSFVQYSVSLDLLFWHCKWKYSERVRLRFSLDVGHQVCGIGRNTIVPVFLCEHLLSGHTTSGGGLCAWSGLVCLAQLRLCTLKTGSSRDSFLAPGSQSIRKALVLQRGPAVSMSLKAASFPLLPSQRRWKLYFSVELEDGSWVFHVVAFHSHLLLGLVVAA